MDDDTDEQKRAKEAVKNFIESFQIAEVILERYKPSYGPGFTHKYLV